MRRASACILSTFTNSNVIQSQKILIWCSTENLENLEMERLAKQKEVNLSLH